MRLAMTSNSTHVYVITQSPDNASLTGYFWLNKKFRPIILCEWVATKAHAVMSPSKQHGYGDRRAIHGTKTENIIIKDVTYLSGFTETKFI